MRKSDVFEEFVKIAEEKGMLSGVTSEEAKKKLEENPRMDSLDISAIEALYGVKPETSKDMDYENNIAELAHPNSVIVSPSYDKINGLVENVNERQNIIMNIIDQTPDGMLRQKKYAEQELILNLVRVGNDLDNKNFEELRVLSDKCLEQVTIKKKAQDPLTLSAVVFSTPFLIGVGATLGLLWLQQHLPFSNKGFQENYKALIGEIDDILNSNANWGVGVEYKQNFIDQMNDFKQRVIDFKNKVDEIAPVVENIEKPKNSEELLELSKNIESINKKNKEFIDESRKHFYYVEQILDNFKKEDYKLRQIKEKGFFTKIIDAPQIFHGGYGLIADDFDDVVRAIKPYRNSVVGIIKVLQNSNNFAKKSTQELKNAVEKEKKPSNSKPSRSYKPSGSRRRYHMPESIEDQISKDEVDIEDLINRS